MAMSKAFTTPKGSLISRTDVNRKGRPRNVFLPRVTRPSWATQFEDLTRRGLEQYLAGERKADSFLNQEDVSFLVSIGTSTQEIYDFLEDWYVYGEPSFETALRITEVRAEYFLYEQQGCRSTRVITPEELPVPTAEIGGFPWLPRIMAKAHAKLRGEMSPEIMYSCKEDRAFLRKVGTEPAQFLRVVWSADDDLDSIVEYVKISAQFQAGSDHHINC
ncbi:MAG: DUF5069 domain-containing protein [Nitrospirales bacterium]|nr:DUF5069 domain-containing protein [Nitrospira sp.]MDR4501992.1 DUF5069 domain-containing protein [Nitrospirales bacterium]